MYITTTQLKDIEDFIGNNCQVGIQAGKQKGDLIINATVMCPATFNGYSCSLCITEQDDRDKTVHALIAAFKGRAKLQVSEQLHINKLMVK